MTKRTLSELSTLFADNTNGAISPADLRDFLESAYGSRQVDSVSTNTTLTSSHDVVLVDATSGGITITLPTAVGVKGQRHTIKKIDSSVNAITIATTSSQTIDGATKAMLLAQYDAIEIISDNANWIFVEVSRTVSRRISSQTASVTVANSVAETTVLGTSIGSKTILANVTKIGGRIKATVSGIISNTATPTLTLKLKLGSTVVLSTGAITTPSGLSNSLLLLKIDATFRTVGGSGTIIGQGFAILNGTIFPLTLTATVTIDTTANQEIDVTAQWGTASASNTLTVTNAEIEFAN